MREFIRPFVVTPPARALFLLAMLLAVACTPVGPDYSAPDPSAPCRWHAAPNNGPTPPCLDDAQLGRWWELLQDPILTDLVALALANSPDMRKALAMVYEARAKRGISEAARYPMLDINSSTYNNRLSQSTSNTSDGREQNWYQTGFDASWEIDIFGRLRRGIEAAQAHLEATEADFLNVRVTLAAEVARNYIELRTYQHRIHVADTNIETQERTYKLIQSRYEAGLSTELETEQARYNLASTRSQVPTLRTGLEAAKKPVGRAYRPNSRQPARLA